MMRTDQYFDAKGEIEALIHRYAKRVDDGDFAGVAELFSAGRIISADGTVLAQGFEAVHEFYSATVRLYPPHNTPLTQHVVSNLVLDIDEHLANGSCQYTVFQCTDKLPLQPVIAGRYLDMFERSDGQWRFRERKMSPQLIGDLSQHLTEDALQRFT